jgi:NTE family protein
MMGMLRFEIPGRVDKRMLDRGIQRAYGSQYFSKVSYKIETLNSRNRLTIIADEKPPQLFQFGARYDSDFKAGLLLNYTQKHALIKGSRFSVDGIVSSFIRYKTEYVISTGWSEKHPHRNRNIDWSPDFGMFFTYESLDPYKYDTLDRGNKVGSFHYVQTNPGIYFVEKLGNNLNVGVGVEFQYASRGSNLINYLINSNTNTFNLFNYIRFDSFNDKWFPTTGAQFDSEIEYGSVLENDDKVIRTFSRYNLFYQHAWRMARHFTFISKIYTASVQGSSVQWGNQVFLGGINNTKMDFSVIPFIGYDLFEVSSRNLFVLRTDFQWNLFGDHYLILKFNAGKKNQYYEDLFSKGNLLIGGGLTYAYKSLVGPVELSILQAQDRKLKVYLSLGFWF